MNQEKRNALKSIIFYAIALSLIALINVSGQFKSGPCTPNLDVLSIFILAVSNMILLIVNGVMAFAMKKETKYSFFVHSFVLITWAMIFSLK